ARVGSGGGVRGEELAGAAVVVAVAAAAGAVVVPLGVEAAAVDLLELIAVGDDVGFDVPEGVDGELVVAALGAGHDVRGGVGHGSPSTWRGARAPGGGALPARGSGGGPSRGGGFDDLDAEGRGEGGGPGAAVGVQRVGDGLVASVGWGGVVAHAPGLG